MIHLSREIRFALVSPAELAANSEPVNSWSAWPASDRVVPQLTLTAVVSGQPDAATGYLCNIKEIDGCLRQVVTERLIPELAEAALSQMPLADSMLQSSFELANESLVPHATLEQLTLALSPRHQLSIYACANNMVQLTQQFEFSAAHRLHCASLSDQQNREVFGKCNNANGHGHNYVIEISVGRPVNSQTQSAPGISVHVLEQVVRSEVVDRLDHKHLNEDIEYFSTVNPTVENIAIAIWNWLVTPLQLAELELAEVRVFETPKTWASYRGK